MKTPVLPLIITFLFQFNTSFSQVTKKPLLYFSSHAFALGIGKNDKPIIGTRRGEIAYLDSPKALWSKTNIDTGHIMSKLYIDQICYFNADTAIVSGFIENNNKTSFICQTLDGGKNWKPINNGMGGARDAAYLDNGEAWLGDPGTGIAYTTDYGQTWSSLAYPVNTEAFNKMFFNYKREGIIGSLWNVLAYTRDNCKTWVYLPTPLNQGKYRKIALGARPQFNRVAIFNDYFLVSQENMVFYSKTDTVNWIQIPGYTDFYTDAVNSALFLERSKGKFTKYDNRLQPTWSFESIRNYDAAICRNGSLFILGENKLLQVNSANQLTVSPLYTYSRWALELQPQPIRNDFTGINNSDLKQFCDKGIKTIIFSIGVEKYHGHVHHSDTAVYELKGDRFVLARKVHKGQAIVDLQDNAVEIDKQVVDRFVKIIPAIHQKRQVTIDDLGFTQSAYDSCKQNILAFKTYIDGKPDVFKEGEEEKEGTFRFYVNNLDFNKLIELTDSVKTIDPAIINDYFKTDDTYYGDEFGLSGNSTRFVLVNENNEVLRFEATINRDSAPFYFPWKITLNGAHSKNMSIEINRFLKDVYSSFLSGSKVQMIQFLVKTLYIKQILDLR